MSISCVFSNCLIVVSHIALHMVPYGLLRGVGGGGGGWGGY